MIGEYSKSPTPSSSASPEAMGSSSGSTPSSLRGGIPADNLPPPGKTTPVVGKIGHPHQDGIGISVTEGPSSPVTELRRKEGYRIAGRGGVLMGKSEHRGSHQVPSTGTKPNGEWTQHGAHQNEMGQALSWVGGKDHGDARTVRNQQPGGSQTISPPSSPQTQDYASTDEAGHQNKTYQSPSPNQRTAYEAEKKPDFPPRNPAFSGSRPPHGPSPLKKQVRRSATSSTSSERSSDANNEQGLVKLSSAAGVDHSQNDKETKALTATTFHPAGSLDRPPQDTEISPAPRFKIPISSFAEKRDFATAVSSEEYERTSSAKKARLAPPTAETSSWQGLAKAAMLKQQNGEQHNSGIPRKDETYRSLGHRSKEEMVAPQHGGFTANVPENVAPHEFGDEEFRHLRQSYTRFRNKVDAAFRNNQQDVDSMKEQITVLTSRMNQANVIPARPPQMAIPKAPVVRLPGGTSPDHYTDQDVLNFLHMANFSREKDLAILTHLTNSERIRQFSIAAEDTEEVKKSKGKKTADNTPETQHVRHSLFFLVGGGLLRGPFHPVSRSAEDDESEEENDGDATNEEGRASGKAKRQDGEDPQKESQLEEILLKAPVCWLRNQIRGSDSQDTPPNHPPYVVHLGQVFSRTEKTEGCLNKVESTMYDVFIGLTPGKPLWMAYRIFDTDPSGVIQKSRTTATAANVAKGVGVIAPLPKVINMHLCDIADWQDAAEPVLRKVRMKGETRFNYKAADPEHKSYKRLVMIRAEAAKFTKTINQEWGGKGAGKRPGKGPGKGNDKQTAEKKVAPDRDLKGNLLGKKWKGSEGKDAEAGKKRPTDEGSKGDELEDDRDAQQDDAETVEPLLETLAPAQAENTEPQQARVGNSQAQQAHTVETQAQKQLQPRPAQPQQTRPQQDQAQQRVNNQKGEPRTAQPQQARDHQQEQLQKNQPPKAERQQSNITKFFAPC
ncbi:hypothetical protein MKZ38_001864 [Zalerion maritima]|uniref:Uncharacterized protein n=1 Tax=Zalerion maritima TaxID=339359 RepID=A0AAD5WR78_9PEZI|nr:hypothetical protein MKZ38_001864 [Zalerion maritima]